MSKTISSEWFSSLPSQFRPEKIIKEELCMFECDSHAEIARLPKCSAGSVAIVRGEYPQLYMKSMTSWVLQSKIPDEVEGVLNDAD